MEDWRQIGQRGVCVKQGHEEEDRAKPNSVFSPYAFTDGISIIAEDY